MTSDFNMERVLEEDEEPESVKEVDFMKDAETHID